TTELYTLSLHDALPIWSSRRRIPRASSRPEPGSAGGLHRFRADRRGGFGERQCPCELGEIDADRRRFLSTDPPDNLVIVGMAVRSEEHTSELQSLAYLV